MTPLETSPRFCSAAFQSSSEDLTFPPRSKIILHRIGSQESLHSPSRDSVGSSCDEDDDTSSQVSIPFPIFPISPHLFAVRHPIPPNH